MSKKEDKETIIDVIGGTIVTFLKFVSALVVLCIITSFITGKPSEGSDITYIYEGL